MANDVQHNMIQERVEQLKAISTRRNDLLQEMYHLMRHRNSIGDMLQAQTDDEDEFGRDTFLARFDIQALGERGFVQNNGDVLPESLGGLEALPLQGIVAASSHDANHPPTRDSNSARSRPKATAVEQLKASLDEAGSSRRHTLRRYADHQQEEIEDEEETDAPGSRDEMDTSSQKAYSTHMQESSSKDLPPSSDDGLDLESVQPSRSEVEDVAMKDRQEGDRTTSVQKQPSEAVNESILLGSASEDQSEPVQTVNPQTIYRPSGSSSIPIQTPKSSIIIPAPLEPSISLDQYNVEDPPQLVSIKLPPQHSRHNKYDYTLPPLSMLPPEFSRKKSTKRKKDKAERQKDVDVPMGINRWTATLNANPLWKRVSKATKCLSTKDWTVAITELRIIRTAERIEALKRDARWGMRQVKKQRGLGGMLKTHWDYLLDEMKWMRIDFREERKWKMAVAYHLSTSVLEWHALQSWEERVECGVCVKWHPQREREPIEDPTQEEDTNDMDVDPIQDDETEARPAVNSNSLLGLDYSSEVDEMDQGEADPEIVNPLDPVTELKEAMEGSELKAEGDESDSAMDIALPATENFNATETSGDQVPFFDEKLALKKNSDDPVLGSKSSSQSVNGDTDEKANASKAKVGSYGPLREAVVYSADDKLFIGPEDFESFHPVESNNQESIPFDLTALFPDLQPLAMLDVAPPLTEVKKKSSRAERDDPNKRVEETSYTKVYAVGKFMTTKPTLLGPLQPGRRWKDGKWLPLEESPVTPDVEVGYVKTVEDSVSDLFDLKTKSSGPALPPQALRDAKRSKIEHAWSVSDDLLLKSLVDKYPGNWTLISECFNGCRKSIPSDRRTPLDLVDRWKTKWGNDLLGKGDSLVNSEDQTHPVGAQMSTGTDAQMSRATSSVAGPSVTTRGVKRLASASISSSIAPTIGAGSETRKRKRHALLQESMKKVTRKKAEQQAKQAANHRKTPGMHETHIQYTKMPKLSPAELSRMKADRDAAQMAEMAKIRARQDEMRQQQHKLNGIPIPPQAAQQAAIPRAEGGQPQPLSQQQVVQHLQNLQAQANRAGTARPAVNIARMATPTSGLSAVGVGVAAASRLTNQQMLQMQQQTQQRLAAATQQGSLNGVAGLAQQYGSRDATASPATHSNSPRVAAVGGIASIPRSPNEAAAGTVPMNHVGHATGASATANGQATRPHANFMFNTNGVTPGNYTADQLNALRVLFAQQQQQASQQAQQPHPQ